MNLYEAIFTRKSTRQYLFEPVSPDVLEKIGAFYKNIPPLFPGIETEIGITENAEGKRAIKGLFPVRAPYYLSIYSEDRDRAEMNAGYIMEQISLYMMTLGLGSCMLGAARLVNAPEERSGKKFVILMAFGKPKGELRRRAGSAKRLEVKELCVFKDKPTRWMNSVIEVARLAPSDANRQPWRFVVTDHQIHIFSRKTNMEHPKKWDEFDFGVMFSHIAIASDELWLDVDLIKLENISQKNFRNNQYVLSAVIRTNR